MSDRSHVIQLEVCIASLGDALTAAKAGAARVELNSALELGGLTPSIGLVECVVDALRPFRCAVISMVRPRPGGFAYDADALDVMRRDIDRLLEAGVGGIALGVLKPGGLIDARACAALIEPIRSAGREAVCHRAFDLTPEPSEALETLIDLGFQRVLTSGGKASALEGAAVIRSLVEQASGRIEVLPGGGVRPHNVRDLIASTGCTQVHASLRSLLNDPSTKANPTLCFNSPPPADSQYGATDRGKVDAMLAALRDTD